MRAWAAALLLVQMSGRQGPKPQRRRRICAEGIKDVPGRGVGSACVTLLLPTDALLPPSGCNTCRRHHGIDMFGRDAFLLGKLLTTLGAFLEASANSPQSVALAAATGAAAGAVGLLLVFDAALPWVAALRSRQ